MELSDDASSLLQKWISELHRDGLLTYVFCFCCREDHEEYRRLVELMWKCSSIDERLKIEQQINELRYAPVTFEISIAGCRERDLALPKFDIHRAGESSFLTIPAFTEFLQHRRIIERNRRLQLETTPSYDETIAILREAGGPFLCEEYAPGEQDEDAKPDTAAS